MDYVSLVSQVAGLLVTVLTATWWLSTRLAALGAGLEKHTAVIRTEMRAIEKEVGALKAETAGSRQEIVLLRERTMRLEALGEGGAHAGGSA